MGLAQKNPISGMKFWMHNFDSPFASTEWSSVYNQQTGEVLYYHRENYDTSYFFRLERK